MAHRLIRESGSFKGLANGLARKLNLKAHPAVVAKWLLDQDKQGRWGKALVWVRLGGRAAMKAAIEAGYSKSDWQYKHAKNLSRTRRLGQMLGEFKTGFYRDHTLWHLRTLLQKENAKSQVHPDAFFTLGKICLERAEWVHPSNLADPQARRSSKSELRREGIAAWLSACRKYLDADPKMAMDCLWEASRMGRVLSRLGRRDASRHGAAPHSYDIGHDPNWRDLGARVLTEAFVSADSAGRRALARRIRRSPHMLEFAKLTGSAGEYLKRGRPGRPRD